jgi:hypothetical protein
MSVSRGSLARKSERLRVTAERVSTVASTSVVQSTRKSKASAQLVETTAVETSESQLIMEESTSVLSKTDSKQKAGHRRGKRLVKEIETPRSPPSNWREVYDRIALMRQPGGIAGDAPVDSMGCASLGKPEFAKNARVYVTTHSMICAVLNLFLGWKVHNTCFSHTVCASNRQIPFQSYCKVT